MYKDLRDNEDAISSHPVVQALACSDPTAQTDSFQFEPIDPSVIDEIAPADKLPLVLDADSSQRAAIAAAVAGRSFVMDGPPGTGKSQTIANMIGALMHAGKTVLFVSEKIAALDVVRNRLEGAGLGSYLLELHSHKTNRREVAAELVKTLDNEVLSPNGMNATSRAALEARRRKLTEYAFAMNELRQPLSTSLHEVLGLLSTLVEVPAAPVPDRSVLELDQAGLAEIYESLRRLQRVWRPAAQGGSYLWRDVVDPTSLETRLWNAKSVLNELQGTMHLNSDLLTSFELDKPSGAGSLARLLANWHTSQPEHVKPEWLTRVDLSSLEVDRDELLGLLDSYKTKSDAVEALSGVAYTSFPSSSHITLPTIQAKDPVDLSPLGISHLRALAEYLDHYDRELQSALTTIRGLADLAGFGEPATFTEADRLFRIAELRASGIRIEASWLSPAGLQAARTSAAEVRLKMMALEAAEAKALSVYRPEALEAPLQDLQDRFKNLHRGLRKLSGTYRADKSVISSLLADASQVKSGISRLSDAIAWSDATKTFNSVAVVHSQLLGSHWQGRSSNWENLDRAFSIADELIRLYNGEVPLQTQIYFNSESPDKNHQQMAESARNTMDAWRNTLASAPALAGRPEFSVGPIEQSIRWIQAHQNPVKAAIELVESANTVSQRDHTLLGAVEILNAVVDTQQSAMRLEESRERFERQFGGLFRGTATDAADLDAAVAWVHEVRNESKLGMLSESQLESLRASTPVDVLPQSIAKWENARDAVANAFAPTRQNELLTEFAEFDSAFGLIEDFGEDPVGQQEWFDYLSVREELRAYDLDDTVNFCIDQRISAADVSKVVERALLRAWADAHIREDSRLHPLTSVDRSALVEEFRALDLEVISAATGDIIRAANLRRPANSALGEPALIRREGMKQRRHMAVRSLISQARTAVQAIKPVFMMSPLAVSQYLPSDIRFDVVIFDEASQVTPGDSINCIYRGRAFILAGDDKQLPPTQFFERATESDDDSDVESDVEDFQSILELAKSAGAFQNIGLRWHYRSRHEALIAFSNYRFYEGKLITYPSAQEDGPDVGVEFFPVDGTYRRGGGADNPKEARAVAERVIHHYRTRPGASLGVVTFSVAQATAVSAAVDELRELNRDLDGYFDKSDRLNGFFVRSLESVQGDERDVIIFSIGYGPDEAGKVSTNFGVLNKEKGWRRLNVGITRARQRIEVVSSMEAHDIPASQNENVEALRAYLDYAKHGIPILGTQSSATGLMPESPFEESVIRVIESWGYRVEPQVGAAGFRIDMAVRHPVKTGVFALGVECDGYQYHSSPAARDRDRLRDQVLEGLGWTLHRIWGTSWYRDRATEERRLRTAIEEAIAEKSATFGRGHAEITRPEVETVPVSGGTKYVWAEPYKPATPQHLPGWVDAGEPGSHIYMKDLLFNLAREEGPVHMDLVYERVREWWFIGRVSARIKQNIDLAIEHSSAHRDGDFIDAPNRTEIRVRPIDNRRKPEQVPIGEFARAIELLLSDVGSAARLDVITHVVRLYGWARNGSILESRMQDAINWGIAAGTIAEDGENLKIIDEIK
nr:MULTISPECIES: AAA domain-containing protein [unclassified Leucobacter]